LKFFPGGALGPKGPGALFSAPRFLRVFLLSFVVRFFRASLRELS
jgi:hypothetical protein